MLFELHIEKRSTQQLTKANDPSSRLLDQQNKAYYVSRGIIPANYSSTILTIPLANNSLTPKSHQNLYQMSNRSGIKSKMANEEDTTGLQAAVIHALRQQRSTLVLLRRYQKSTECSRTSQQSPAQQRKSELKPERKWSTRRRNC